MNDDDLISYLFSGGQKNGADPSAMIAALRNQPLSDNQKNQQLLGTLGQLSGDRVLSPVGQNLTQDVERQQQRSDTLGEKRVGLAMTMKEKQDQLSQNKELGLGRIGEEFRHNKETEDLRREGNQIRRQGLTQSSAALGLSQDALEQAADSFLATGTLPQLGLGKAAGAAKAQIINRAAEKGSGNWAGNKAEYGANIKSLGKLQSQADATNAFENTALANLDQFVTTAKNLGIDTGSPLLNMPARQFSEHVAGDPKMSALVAARETAIQEISKVLSGAMGNAGVSDAARKEASGLLKPDATLAQIMSATAVLKKDMANRHKAFDEQIGSIKSRIGASHDKAAVATPDATQPTAQGEDIVTDKSGKRWRVNHQTKQVLGEAQ